MYLFFTFTGDGGGLIGERELPVGGGGTLRGGGDVVIYLGILERGVSFFFFFFS